MELRVLGPLEVRGAPCDATLLRGRERTLLAALALELDQIVSHRALVDALWPGDLASHTSGVKTYVMRLRQAVGPAAIHTSGGGYRLSDDGLSLDSRSFERDVSSAASTIGRVHPVERVERLTETLRAWRGRPFDELGDWPPAVRERLRLEELRQVALELRSDAGLEAGTASIAGLEHLVDEAPLRERRWEQLMIGLYRSGRQAEALRAFGRARELLRDELGLAPSAELVRLEQAILHQDPSLEIRASTGPPADASTIPWAIDQAIERGERQLLAGDPAAALDTLLQAAALARQVGDTGRLLRCAIAASGEGWNSGLDPHAAHVQLLEEAARLPASYSPLRAQVLARLSVARSYHEPVEVSRTRVREALDLARLVGDRTALAVALEAVLIIERDPTLIDQRETWVQELETLTAPSEDGPVAPWVTMISARAGIEAARGDIDRAIETLRTIDRWPHPRTHHLGRMIATEAQVLDASRRGDWPATRVALAALCEAGLGALLDPAASTLAREGALGLVASLEGADHPASRFTLAPFPVTSGEVMLVAGAARACTTRDEGREVLAGLVGETLPSVTRDLLWPSMIWAVSEAAADLAAAEVASCAYRAARSFGWMTVVNPGGIYLGSMEHHLGVLATTFGDDDRADRHLVAALEAHRSAGATEWVRRTEQVRADRS